MSESTGTVRVAATASTGAVSPDASDLMAVVAHYQGLFGAENVKVMAYEAFRADPAGFLDLDPAVLRRESPEVSLRALARSLPRELSLLVRGCAHLPLAVRAAGAATVAESNAFHHRIHAFPNLGHHTVEGTRN